MKHLFIYFLLFTIPAISLAQTTADKSIPAPLIPTSKTSLLRDVDVFFNTRMAQTNSFLDNNHTKSLFSLNELRFEIKGKIHEKVFFRFRNRYTKIPDPSTIDNMSRAVDMAYLTFDVAPKSKFTVGKMIGDWGGYELLLNPIEVISFNSLIEKSDLFLVGAAFTQSVPELKSKFNVQVLNSKTRTFEEQFGTSVPPGITESKTPMVAVGNWKGSFFNGKFETSYSYCYAIDAESRNRKHITLGNKFKTNNFVLYYDFQYSKEDLDHKGIVSNIIKKQQTYAAQDVAYLENWIRIEYKIQPRVNLLLSVMNTNSYWNGNPDANKNNKLMTSVGIIPKIEYTPVSDFNLKFFVAYVGKRFNYSTYAEKNFNAVDFSTAQVSIGLIAPLLVL